MCLTLGLTPACGHRLNAACDISHVVARYMMKGWTTPQTRDMSRVHFPSDRVGCTTVGLTCSSNGCNTSRGCSSSWMPSQPACKADSRVSERQNKELEDHTVAASYRTVAWMRQQRFQVQHTFCVSQARRCNWSSQSTPPQTSVVGPRQRQNWLIERMPAACSPCGAVQRFSRSGKEARSWLRQEGLGVVRPALYANNQND